jgi:hypothetical protein
VNVRLHPFYLLYPARFYSSSSFLNPWSPYPQCRSHPNHQVFEEYKHRQVNLTILGTGAWGSALAHIANTNDHNVRMWSRRSEMFLCLMRSMGQRLF